MEPSERRHKDKNMVATVDYKSGNLRSVENALKRIGAEYIVTSNPSEIKAAGHVILPGVGDARQVIRNIEDLGLTEILQSLTQPVLGICIGLQIMCRHSSEGDTECLGIFDADVVRLEADLNAGVKIPHIGWSPVGQMRGPLFNGIQDNAYLYFVHSYAAPVFDGTIAETEHGRKFSAAINRGNFYGVQFHPEKSGEIGSQILANFLAL